MGYATGLLEYSDDPLSDATPTYVDRSSYLVGDVSWADGKSRDLDEPQAGGITFRLDNRDGEWIPNSADSLYPDSPFLLRRFRWSVNGEPEGVWYVTKWDVQYPTGRDNYGEVQVTAVDGFELLSLDALDLLDPPTASAYEEVVMHDAPFLYARLGEAASSAVPVAAGPEGVYQAATQVRLGQPGGIIGDTDTAVRFTTSGATRGRARFPLSATENVNATDELTLECWFKLGATANDARVFFAGPNASGGSPIWTLTGKVTVGDHFELNIGLSPGSGTYATYNYGLGGGLDVDSWYFFAVTYSPGQPRMFLGSYDDPDVVGGFHECFPVLDGATAGGNLLAGVANGFIYVGADVTGADGSVDVTIDEAAVYERVISPERIEAHYLAGAERGFDEQTSGERIAAVADSPLWAETEIETGAHMVHPVMEHGQSKLDEIRAAVKAEMPDTHFFFNGDGDPVYLGWDYKGTAPFNESQGTFGPGGILYQDVELVYDDEILNDVTVGHEAAPGEEAQHTETDEDSVDEFYRRAHSETGLILTEHHDAIAVAAAILEAFHQPTTRVASLTLNGAQSSARTHILERQIGDLIRVKGLTGTPDVLTTILGRSKTLTAAGHLTCTWTLARGLDASADVWYLGMDGYSELGETTVPGLMAWTSTTTRATGYLVTAAVWNNEHVENMQHLEEVAYAQVTSDLSVTATTAATAQTVVSAGAITFEAVPHIIEFSTSRVQVGNTGISAVTFDLWDASTQLGIIGYMENNAAALIDMTFKNSVRITPTAASHTYIWKAWRADQNGTVFAGTGAANDNYPAFIRIYRVTV